MPEDERAWMFHQSERDKAVALGGPIGLAVIISLVAGLLVCAVIVTVGLLYEWAYGILTFVITLLVWAATGAPV